MTNSQTNNEFCQELTPLIQGILEILLQCKEEISYLKESYEICLTLPARLKNLIEYLPLLSKPLIESLKSSHFEHIQCQVIT